MTRTTVLHTAVRFAGALIAAAALLAGLSGLARPVAAAGDCTVTAADLTVDGDESGLLTSINQYRQSKGKAPLAQSAALTRAAAWMSRDMATRNYAPGSEKDHPASDGRLIKQRQADCGYPLQVFSQENIYEGYGGGATATAALQWWKNSPYGHNEAMLNEQHTYAGIARSCDANGSRCFWTLELGAEAGAAQGTPAIVERYDPNVVVTGTLRTQPTPIPAARTRPAGGLCTVLAAGC
jgi:uncharacterized protein YkwD